MPGLLSQVDIKKSNQNSGDSVVRQTESYCSRSSFKNKTNSQKSLGNHHVRTYSLFPRSSNEDLTYNLYILWLNEQLCDVELSVGKESIKAHKVILASYSGYIRDMLSLQESRYYNKIPLLGVKKNIAWNIIQALYSFTLMTDTVDDSLSTATFLRIPALISACSNFLKEDLSIENCLRTLQVANLYNLSALFEDVCRLVCSDFENITEQKIFFKLRYCELLVLLPRDDLQVSNEIVVFEAVLQWVAAERASRMKYTSRLLRNVRFALIAEQDLVRKVLTSSHVLEIAEICEIVYEALRYHRIPLKRAAVAPVRSKLKLNCLVACGGLALKSEGSVTNRVFFCDLENGEWKILTHLPEKRHHHAAAVLGGFLYVAGGDSEGGSSNPSDKVWRYDHWNDEWREVASMNAARESFQMVTLDFKLYVIGGRSCGNRAISSVESYNPGENIWFDLMPITSPRRHVAAAALHGLLYAVGGSSKNLISRRTERYNPLLDRWERRKPTHKPRFGGSLHPINGRLYLVGGISTETHETLKGMRGEAEVEMYSPQTDQWAILSTLPLVTLPIRRKYSVQFGIKKQMSNQRVVKSTHDRIERQETNAYRVKMPRTESAACCYNGKIFLIGGYSWLFRERIADTECIDIETLTSCKKTSRNTNEVEKVVDNYPLHCTGIASVSMTLRKLPRSSKPPQGQFANAELSQKLKNSEL